MSVTVDDITKISHQFAVEWKISIREVRELAEISDPVQRIILRSSRYRFKNIDNLEFSYELLYGDYFQMRVKCITDMPLFLEDVLVLVKDRIYRVQCNPTNTVGRLIFDRNALEGNSFENDEVTFHCIMSIPAQVKAVIPIPGRKKSAETIVECESIVTIPDLYPYGYDAVNQFRYSSRIPDFNVKMATRLISETHERHIPILKALCAEYLTANLTTENAAEVLKQAIASDAKDLLQKCGDFISEKCKIVSIH